LKRFRREGRIERRMRREKEEKEEKALDVGGSR
jgi:hypothetical protein